MITPLSTLVLAFAAISSLVLGGLVLLHNPYKRTHRAFAVLAINIMLWTFGVLVISHCHTKETARFWLQSTFVVAAFLPATFFYFICVFPRQRFEGPKWLSGFLYAAAAALSVLAFSPWYLHEITVHPAQPPVVVYGPVFYGFVFCISIGMLFAYPNLFHKLQNADGIEKRQIQHVLLGVFLSTFLSSATNVFAPALDIPDLEPYGPAFMVVMMAIFSYSMIRYHLMDIRVILTRTTVYAAGTAIVALIFLGTVSLVHWAFSRHSRPGDVVPTVLAALVIVLVLQPVRERIQLVLNRTILKRRYDVQALLARMTRHSSQIVHFDELLRTVAQDVTETIGVKTVRVLVVDEADPATLITAFSTIEDEKGRRYQQGELLEYLRETGDALVLEEIIHSRPTPHRARIAQHLADLDAFLCVPLRSASGLVGLLVLGQKITKDIYTRDDVLVFSAVGNPLATAMENARLYQEIQEVNLHRARILSTMRGGVIAVDKDGVVTTINEAAQDMTGAVEVGWTLDRICPEVADVLRYTLTQRRGVRDFETIIRRPGREEISVVMSSSCLDKTENVVAGAMIMIYDLTQVKQLEANVQRAHRLSSIGTLAAGMAHEIKNPLVPIKTFSQLLPTRYDDPEFRATFVEVVPHEVDRIDSIVTRLLDFARPKPAQFAPQNLRELIDEVLALVENQVRKANISVQVDIPDEFVEVYGDEQQLHQVFLNLMLNAVDAMRAQQQGQVSVCARRAKMRTRRNGSIPLLEVECVKLSVADSGPGITQENLDRIFTPFYTTKENGTGLGLSVVYSIITEHGGQIEVDSTPGLGTTFTVTLPLAQSVASAGSHQQ